MMQVGNGLMVVMTVMNARGWMRSKVIENVVDVQCFLLQENSQ
jgi:hypothetical protein